jgi:acetyl-CoA carboxylase biotin carboxyl carrier protein
MPPRATTSMASADKAAITVSASWYRGTARPRRRRASWRLEQELMNGADPDILTSARDATHVHDRSQAEWSDGSRKLARLVSRRRAGPSIECARGKRPPWRTRRSSTVPPPGLAAPTDILPRDQRAREDQLSDVEAHITGTVWKIEVEIGDNVDEGDTVVILESMKMEMPVEAEDPGTVKEIRVQEGQSVSEGDTLVVLE